jgi:hypothetical protein
MGMICVERGDISNTVSPRLYVVFENLVAAIPLEDRAKFSTAVKLHRWKRAVEMFVANELFAKYAWDITWRMGFTLDCVTWMPDDMAQHVEEWLDKEGLPFSSFHRYDPNRLARRIATMPDVAAIYDPDPDHRLLFGRKGRFLTSEDPNLAAAF